jgi:hypothetical protein
MPTLTFNSLISQLDDSELANFYYEMGRQNSINYIKKILSDQNMNTTHIVLLCAVDFGASTQGSVYWRTIFDRLQP